MNPAKTDEIISEFESLSLLVAYAEANKAEKARLNQLMKDSPALAKSHQRLCDQVNNTLPNSITSMPKYTVELIETNLSSEVSSTKNTTSSIPFWLISSTGIAALFMISFLMSNASNKVTHINSVALDQAPLKIKNIKHATAIPPPIQVAQVDSIFDNEQWQTKIQKMGRRMHPKASKQTKISYGYHVAQRRFQRTLNHFAKRQQTKGDLL